MRRRFIELSATEIRSAMTVDSGTVINTKISVVANYCYKCAYSPACEHIGNIVNTKINSGYAYNYRKCDKTDF